MDLRRIMSFLPWFSKTENISTTEIISKTETTIAETPEHYLQLIENIVDQVELVRSGSMVPKFNLGLCRYLADKLTVAVDKAYPILQYQLGKESPTEFLKIIKLLYGLAKKVEGFVNECCYNGWIQAAVLLTNMLEHVSSIGFCLKIWANSFSDPAMYGECGDIILASVSRIEIEAVEKIAAIDKEVSRLEIEAVEKIAAIDKEVSRLEIEAVEKIAAIDKEVSRLEIEAVEKIAAIDKEVSRLEIEAVEKIAAIDKEVSRLELEAVEKIAAIDKEVLLKKLEAHVRSSASGSDDGYLATHLLGLLGPSSAQASSGLKSYEVKDMSHLSQLESVGKGSSATVYRAKFLGLEVAKKTFDVSGSDEFEKEVSILAGLSHPNITPLLCYAKGERDCSIVMELMDEDLYGLIRKRLRDNASRGVPFTVREAVDVIFQVARGMHYLHEKNIVHRDLKSMNILVKYLKKTELAELESEYVVAKVSDFGLSKTKESSTRFSNQTPNTGTTRWMAPEVMMPNVEGKPKHPFKADVYSFGMVCYEILTGSVPFQGMSERSIREKILAGEPPQKHLKLPNWCPTKLGNMIIKCWSLDAKERPRFDEICEVLREVQCELMRNDCEYLKFDNFENKDMDNLLKSLRDLGCKSLDELPQSITKLKYLTHLNLVNCSLLTELLESIGILKCLTHLNLTECFDLKELPEGIGNLSGLTHLDLSGCKSLQQLPEDISNLSGLTNLDLSGCESLQQLQEGIGNLSGLTNLNLSGCESLQQLLEDISNLSGLTNLDLSGCESLQQLPEGIDNLSGLTNLDLSRCESLQQLPEGIGNLSSLTNLDLSGCVSLEQLPEGIGNLSGLTNLGLSRCVSLEQLPESIGNLSGFTHLDLSGCESLEQLPQGISNLSGLTNLDLSRCECLQQLPEDIGNLSGLTNLDLSRCESLEQLPEGIGNLSGLTNLDLSGCGSLKQLPEGIGNLSNLKNLGLSGCESLEQLPKGIGNLSGLTNLDLSRCVSLQQLTEGINNLSGLTNLNLSRCESLQQLPEGIDNLIGLRYLDLYLCKSLHKLPESMGDLTGLTNLNLKHSGISLKRLPESLRNRSGLTISHK